MYLRESVIRQYDNIIGEKQKIKELISTGI